MARTAAQAEDAGITDRSVLPLPEPQYPPITELDVRNLTPPPLKPRLRE
jgi:arylsulfatase